MLRGLLFAGAVTVALLAWIASQWTPPTAPPITSVRQGRNNTVLFLTTNEHGLSNVFVATAYTLLRRHPEVEVHYASFPSMGRKLKRISERAREIQPSARSIVYHGVPDLSFLSIMIEKGRDLTSVIHPPGYAGIDAILGDMPFYTSPWSGEDHMTLFDKYKEIIEEVDPSLVVLDTFLRPALHATRSSRRLYAFVSPLTPIELFPLEQPYFRWLWKYPVMGSGIPYPVPWSKLPENLYINIQYFYTMLRLPGYAETRKYIASKGITDPVSWFNLRSDEVPFFSQALPGASMPVDVLPPNVTLTGPIILSTAKAEDEAPALTRWLARGPTVLISLGSLYMWSERQATIMAQAIADTLAWREDLQFLWKFMKMPYDAEGATYGDEFLEPLRPYLENGRLKIESWLEVQPVSLLETGHIVLSVHHGGAGCYSEALATGVPQLVLPQWLDHYSFATVAQSAGVGVWGCPDASPWWTADCLRNAYRSVLGGYSGDFFRKKAKHFSDIARKDPGENIVAREIAKLAATGYSS